MEPNWRELLKQYIVLTKDLPGYRECLVALVSNTDETHTEEMERFISEIKSTPYLTE